MESTENSPESSKRGEDKIEEGGNNDGVKDTALAADKSECPSLDNGDKKRESSLEKSPVSQESERLPSPDVPSEESTHLEKSEESSSKDDFKVAEHLEDKGKSNENVVLSVTEPEAASSNSTELVETVSAEKALSEPSPVSAEEGEENDLSDIGLIGNKNIEEVEEGIRPESSNETEEVEQGSTKNTSEISKEDCSSSKEQLSPLGNKDLLGEPEKLDDAVADEKSRKENVSSPEIAVASDKKLPDEPQSSSCQSEDKTDYAAPSMSEAAAETSTNEPMDVDEGPVEKGSSVQDNKGTEDNLDAIARADIDNDHADDAMEVSTPHDENDPLSSATEKEKDVDQSEDKNEGCEVEIHTDIVKDEEYQVNEDSKSNDSSEKERGTGKELESKSTTEVPDKTGEEVLTKSGDDSEKTLAQEAAAKEGDDDVCIIPDTVPQMMRKKLKEITEKTATETPPSTDKATGETTEGSDGVVEVKEPRKEKKKSRDVPAVDLDLTSPRPQRQAAKKAETQIKVLAAVESYEPPPEPKPTLSLVEKATETNPCQQCGLVTFCKYQLRSKDSLIYFCRELCYKEYQSPNGSSVPVVGATSSPPTSATIPALAELERPFERTCSQCSAKIIVTDERVLTWETMDFCTEECLGKYQTALGSHCANCKGAVQNSSLGKYCVRFGYDIKQFCCASCLEEFKKGLKVCSYCQKDISSDQGGFLAPVGDKGQFKDFCTPTCMEKYEQMSSAVAPPVPCHECAVCMEQKPVRVEVLSASRVHKLCSQPCFAAFKFVNAIVADQCDMCKKYFDKAKSENFTIFYDDAPHSFCCKTCMNVYILAKRKIVPCSWCKVKKYNFDMIKKTTSTGQVVMMCSLHCLNLYQVSVSAVSARRVKCDSCGTMVSAQYHLTMSDASMRNFCSYNCVGAFQSKFSRSAVAAAGKDDTPVPTGGPKRAISRRSMMSSETETGGKTVALPVISSVTSLAPNGEPVPAGVQSTVPGTIKVRGQQRKFSDRELTDLGKQSSGDSAKWTSKQHIIVRPPHQPQRNNSGVQVKPLVHHKGLSCKPTLCVKETQTDDDLGKKTPIIVPIPVPIYIPAPMCMYSAPAPVPVPFPLPIPVPIFIPTTRNSTKGIMKEIKRIQEKIPADPFEAELLMMAEMVAAEKKSGNAEESESEEGEAPPEEPSGTDAGNGVSQTFSPEAVDSSNTFGDDIMQMALKFASSLDEQPVDFDSAVAPCTITSGGSQNTAEDEDSDSDADNAEATETKRVTRKRAARAASRSAAPSKRSRRVSSSESLPVHPPSDGSTTSTRTDLEKPDANMCLKYTYGVNAWRQWVLQKNAQLEKAATSNRKLKLFKTDLLQLTADELNYSLCLFVKEVRKPNGTEYAPDTIYYLCLGIQLYLIENGRVDNIFSDPFFEKFTECLDEISKRFSTLYDDTQFIVTRVEEEHLWEAKQLGAHSPHVLLSTLMFFNTKHFNITTVEEHMMLSFSHIMKHWKRNNNAPGSGKTPGRNVLLRFYPSQAALDSNSKKKKVYEQSENEDDPLRCPVKLYEFYLSKCPESVKTRNDLFYLQPERSCVPDSPVWYSTASLNKETLLKMLRRVKMVKEINVAILK